jgi:hypothetical protein
VTVGPHVGEGMPAASQSSGDAVCVVVPCSGSPPGGPQSGFELWRESVSSTGSTVYQPDPLNLISQLSKLSRDCKL